MATDGDWSAVRADVEFRDARRDELESIVALLLDDPLAAERAGAFSATPDAYAAAFDEIEADPRNRLIVGVRDHTVVATLQLTYIPGLSRLGTERAQLEAVRVAAEHRGQRVGAGLVSWAVEQARARGCSLVQLTTDERRPDAHRFYAALGFRPSHVGMKLLLESYDG